MECDDTCLIVADFRLVNSNSKPGILCVTNQGQVTAVVNYDIIRKLKPRHNGGLRER